VNVFDLRDRVVDEYASYVRSFVDIRDGRIRAAVDKELKSGLLWPEPFVGLNPAFKPGAWVDELVAEGVLHQECSRIFRRKTEPTDDGDPLRLHRHQEDAIRRARDGKSYVLTTGTGSGKSLAYMVPIVDHVLRAGRGNGIKAIVVYPMNALANSQLGELEKFLNYGYPDQKGPVSFARYTGQENDERRNEIIASPPDILLTNYVMLELILTRVRERPLVGQAKGLRFLVLDEMHTYRGRQGADVAFLVRRTREACQATALQCVGTSATLASEGTLKIQQQQVAEVASLLFGARVDSDDVVVETLDRSTAIRGSADSAFVAALKTRVQRETAPTADYGGFIADPLSEWVEQELGLRDTGEGRLVRHAPRQLTGKSGAAMALAQATDLPEDVCLAALKSQLLAGYEAHQPETGRPAFAFRLHQFLSRGDTVYASLEPIADRYIGLEGQRFVPGGRDRLLYPLAFCRQCGQEYYIVRRHQDHGVRMEPRAFDDQTHDSPGLTDGYLYLNDERPWPDGDAAFERLPEEWIEQTPRGDVRIKSSQRDRVPRPYEIKPDGSDGSGSGPIVHFIPRPFRLCLYCGTGYSATQRSDFSKLATLGSGGRSTATTVVSLAALRWLRGHTDRKELQKLLAFTDNRQDASLQAGHFNDFVQTSLLRAALNKAVQAAGPNGLGHDELASKVFEELRLPFEEYAANPLAEFAAKKNTDAALRALLGYRLYVDLRRGWRLTAPNLEQCGLLRFRYESLDELCESNGHWVGLHPALASASPSTRERISAVLLDYMRRELCVQVDYLDTNFQEKLKLQSGQYLADPWRLDESERLEFARILFPRSERPGEFQGWTFLSGRGGLGRFLRLQSTFPDHHGRLSIPESERIVRELLDVLQRAGLVQKVHPPATADDPGGYQLMASGLRWSPGDGRQGQRDPIRMILAPESGVRANPYFTELYKALSAQPGSTGSTLEAREHTAQVPAMERERREQRFRSGDLPVLYCSPTMELGIDISSLNVVGMRNVPPAASNYAQRSGRAGRADQPALVFTYCSTGSPHDQYFFRRPQLMTSGQVSLPRLDLANEDLVRAHMDAIWLAQSHLSLGRNLTDVVDGSGEQPALELQPHIQAALTDPGHRDRAKARVQQALVDILPVLTSAPWWGPDWLDDTLGSVALRFEQACARWRDLYRNALAQAKNQDAIIRDATRPIAEKREAERRRQQAESQLRLLTSDTEEGLQADFGSYRYFATEGFLPGYSFPRLPLTAWIPGRRGGVGQDEYLQRPRFLAISEFGPRNIVYHEGSRYVIDQVQLPLDPSAAPGNRALITETVKRCGACGYLHPVRNGAGPDVCERCGIELDVRMEALLRLQHVYARRRDRINADEEERQRQGYEIATGMRFATHEGREVVRTAKVNAPDGTEIASLVYGPTATLWRINLGWRRRPPQDPLGFLVDVDRGRWAKGGDEDDDPDNDPAGGRVQRVIPFVEDRRNCLLVIPASPPDKTAMASLQAAMRDAIAAEYQLEDSELASEALPSAANRRRILFYEAAEGGAGVLRRMLDDPAALAAVARAALELCHFDPVTGTDLHRAPGARENCEAACYDCLLSYDNQIDHPLLDRQAARELLISLANSQVVSSPEADSRGAHLQKLLKLTSSELEKEWLRFVDGRRLRLPDRAAAIVEQVYTRPDFLYDGNALAAVYIDGPLHALADLAVRDAAQTNALENLGYTVIRFGHDEDWEGTVKRFPWVFGTIEGTTKL
jgi:ATP-dependent helicase YprA (DUF1998 family)